MRFYILYIVCFVAFVGVHYMEGLPPVGGFSMAQLWKIPILMYLLFICMTSRRKYAFEKSAYYYSIESFLCPAIITNPLSIIIFASKQLPLVLFFGFIKKKLGDDINILERILFTLAQFICLTSLLTLTGMVEPIRGFMSAEAFIEDMNYYSSLFGAPHAASSYFFISVMVLITGFALKRFRSLKSKFFNGTLLGVALLSLFEAYVRTGWLMLIVALISYFDIRQLSYKKGFKYLLAILICSVGIIYLYQTNDTFRVRISGERIYGSSSTGTVDTDGSGRRTFWANGVEQWSKNDIYGLFFGKGYDAVLDDNYHTSGLRVFSHNQFVDSLAQYGIISLILLLLFYMNLYKFIKVHGRYSPYYPLCRSVFFATIVFSFFQNEMYFNYAVIFAIILCLMQATNKRFCSNSF